MNCPLERGQHWNPATSSTGNSARQRGCNVQSPAAVGDVLGDRDGDTLGDTDGDALGLSLGLVLGDTLGPALGLNEGDVLGLALGDPDGLAEGLALGNRDGLALGEADGLALGENDGLPDGLTDGDALGACVQASSLVWPAAPTCFPAGHAAHAILPCAAWYQFAGHSRQVSALDWPAADDEYFPATHGVHALCPAAG